MWHDAELGELSQLWLSPTLLGLECNIEAMMRPKRRRHVMRHQAAHGFVQSVPPHLGVRTTG